MALRPLHLPRADVAFDPGWLPQADADALLEDLRTCVAWQVHRLRLFGREVDAPRLSCWIGDPGASYRYSGTHFDPHPWPRALLPVRTRLEREAGVAFDSVLANRYRGGSDAMGWHSDDEPELGAEPVIASLSLGATRRFRLKPRMGDDDAVSLDLPHGSLLLMRGTTQEHWRHALPRTARAVGERINLTFRRIVRPARAPSARVR